MVIASFGKNEKYKIVSGLYQYDYGQVLRVQGLNLPAVCEFHFALQESGGTSVAYSGKTKDGVTDVLIPNSMLENRGTDQNYEIYVFVYVTDANSGKTEYRILIPIISRPKPEEFQRPIPDGPTSIEIAKQEAIQTANQYTDAQIASALTVMTF